MFIANVHERRRRLAERWEYVIVGAGIAGLSMAEALTRTRTRSVRLLILEGGRVGSGASTRNAGRLTHASCTTPERAIVARDARQHLLALQTRIRRSFHLQPLGELTALYHERERATIAQQVLPSLRAAGLRGRLIGPPQIGRHVRGFDASGAVAALLTEESIAVHHDAVLFGLLQTVLERGVTIVEATPVTAIVGSWTSACAVVAAGEQIQSDHVVLCCAEGAPRLMEQAGWRTPLQVVRQQAIIVASLHDQGWPIVRWTGPDSAGSCHRVARGEVLAASQDPIADTRANNGCTLDFLARTARQLAQKFPVLRHAAIIRQWGGTTTMTADHLPYAGPVPGCRRLWALYGMNAFTMYPLFADHLANAVCGATPSELLTRSALTPARGVMGV